MSEATKTPLMVSPCEQKIVDADGDSYAYMSRKNCTCRCVPKPVLWFSRRAAHIITCVNEYEKLVAACNVGRGSANNLIQDLEDYESLTLDQLRFKIKTSLIILKSLRDTCSAALAQHAEAPA